MTLSAGLHSFSQSLPGGMTDRSRWDDPLPRLVVPVGRPVLAPGVSRRTGAPRAVTVLAASAIVMLGDDGAPTSLAQAPDGTSGASENESTSQQATTPSSGIMALRRGTFAVVCAVCEASLPKYTCPKCGVPYCSLTCYRAPRHGERCAEQFYEDQVRNELRATRAGSTDRATTLRALARADRDATETEYASTNVLN
jgi:hypothetical protein